MMIEPGGCVVALVAVAVVVFMFYCTVAQVSGWFGV